MLSRACAAPAPGPGVVAVVERDGRAAANGQPRGVVPPRDYEVAACGAWAGRRDGASLYSAASHSHRFSVACYLLLSGYDQQRRPIRLLYRRWARPVDRQRRWCCWVSKRRPEFSSSILTHWQH